MRVAANLLPNFLGNVNVIIGNEEDAADVPVSMLVIPMFIQGATFSLSRCGSSNFPALQ